MPLPPMRPVAMLEVGEEIWIYYNGKPTDVETGNPAFPESQRVGNCVGLARLPRDRFASINGGDEPGQLTTRPIDFHGSRLHVNATVARGGENCKSKSCRTTGNRLPATGRPTACRSPATTSTCRSRGRPWRIWSDWITRGYGFVSS